jgi:hypothetical protein
VQGCPTPQCFDNEGPPIVGAVNFADSTTETRCASAGPAQSYCYDTDMWINTLIATYPGGSCLYEPPGTAPAFAFRQLYPLGWKTALNNSSSAGCSVSATQHTRVSAVDVDTLDCLGSNVYFNDTVNGAFYNSQTSSWNAYADGPPTCVDQMTFTHEG